MMKRGRSATGTMAVGRCDQVIDKCSQSNVRVASVIFFRVICCFEVETDVIN